MNAPALDSDRDLVVTLLQRAGPHSLTALRRHPDLSAWGSTRIEEAVVRAWSDDLLSIDPRDRLIAL